jgi:PAS domain S-box-containing protein
LIALIGVNMLVVVVASVVFYIEQRRSLLREIDTQLLSVATLAREMFPADYHDRITGPDSVSDKAFQQSVERNNSLCQRLGLEYVWSLMLIDGRIVFTSSTSPDKVAEHRLHAKFFETHTNPEAYAETFATMQTTYRRCHDKWGDIRMVLVPWYDGHGRKYLFAASVRLTDVNRQLNAIVRDAIFVGSAVFVLSIVFGLWIARIVTLPIQQLTETIRMIVAGHGGGVAVEQGTYEQITLARAINGMNRVLQEKISDLEAAKALLLDQRETERRQARDDLAMSEQRYHDLLNFAVDGVLIGTRDGVIIEANECICSLFGLKLEDLVGKHIREAPFTSESLMKRPFQLDLVCAGEVVVSERTIRRPDGSEVIVELKTKMMADGTLQSIVRDVTERENARKLLESWNATLERRVAERTAEVERYARQLQALSGRLVRVEEDERQRFSEILHEDLQQVLVAARMTVDAACSSVSDKAGQASLARVNDMLAQGLRLTRTLVQEIAIPAVRQGDLPFAIDWIARQALEKFGLRVSVTYAETLDPVDKSVYICIYRVLQEVLFNIVKHAGVKEATIEVCREEGNYIRVSVCDKGCGFSVAAQTQSSTGDKGVGLFSIRERVEMLCGRLDVFSAVGKGTTVVLLMPMNGASEESAVSPDVKGLFFS